jgi:hypothetical protein
MKEIGDSTNMGSIWIIILLVVNFGISWWNATAVGRIWSEAKQMGGGTRVLVVSGYIMAIAGFTMVYSTILAYIVATVGPHTEYLSQGNAQLLLQLISDMSYLLIIFAIIPTGIIIWINSLITFWKHKSLRTGGIAAWNTYATARNIISASRYAPSAFRRIAKSVKGSKNNGAIILLAIVIVLLAVLGGYFTASAIMKHADRKYDLFGAVNNQKLAR